MTRSWAWAAVRALLQLLLLLLLLLLPSKIYSRLEKAVHSAPWPALPSTVGANTSFPASPHATLFGGASSYYYYY